LFAPDGDIGREEGFGGDDRPVLNDQLKVRHQSTSSEIISNKPFDRIYMLYKVQSDPVNLVNPVYLPVSPGGVYGLRPLCAFSIIIDHYDGQTRINCNGFDRC
jgi:hypothetical protein